MGKRRRYSDSDKAAALAALDANGGNVYKTARELKLPMSTLQEWASGRINHAIPELRERKKEEISQRLVDVVHQLIDALPTKITDANLQQVSTSLGIAVEKIQLLDGDPTDRTEVIDNATRAERINAILERGRTRRAGQADSGGEYVQ